MICVLFAFMFLFVGTSCGGKTKYRDGDICGEATPTGTNSYSQIRNFYIEQFVYELNLPLVKLAEGENKAGDYAEFNAFYSKKFIIENNALVEVQAGADNYNQAHYMFVYDTGSEASDAMFNAYATANFPESVERFNKLIDICSGDNAGESSPVNCGYFQKVSNMDLDDSTGPEGANINSVKNRMTAHSKACLVFTDGFVDPATGVTLPKTTWKDAWNVGLLYGLFVFPMAWLINLFVTWFGGTGWAQIGAILLVTIILKVAIFLLTFKSQSSTQKMQDIQPEILKIQAKYGQNPSQEDKQRMSMELMNVYQKYGVKPFAPFVSMLITFPVFIAMYRAVMFLGVLRTGDINGVILGKNLSSYIIGGNGFNFVAIIIFILMAASQIVSMKLPQIMNRKRMSEEAKKQQKQTNMMSNMMMIMILVMGFMMPVTMSVYWIASALVGVLQSVLMHYMNNSNKNGKGKFKLKKEEKTITIPQGYKK